MKPKLNFKTSFFQDAYTLLEELAGVSPAAGLPSGFAVRKADHALFKSLQRQHNIAKLFCSDFKKVKLLKGWNKLKAILNRYKAYWIANRNQIFQAKNKLKLKSDFFKSLTALTKIPWINPCIDVYLVLGGTAAYDANIGAIRLGVRQKKEEYLMYSLCYALIAFHLAKHAQLELQKDKEKILCMAILKSIFKGDSIAQSYLKEMLNAEELAKVNEIAKAVFARPYVGWELFVEKFFEN